MGVARRDDAGANTGAIPPWKWLATQTYDTGRLTLILQERWFSDGVFNNNNYVVCQTSCPVSTGNFPTVNFNRMNGEFYLDLGTSFNLTGKVSLYAKVDNVFDNDPTPSPQTNTGLDVNPALYDTLGRIYCAGVRFAF